MAITVTTKNETITASVADDKITATVSPAATVSATVQAGFGATGPAGSSGVVAVTAPITNAGTSTAAVVGLSVGSGLAVSSGTLVVSGLGISSISGLQTALDAKAASTHAAQHGVAGADPVTIAATQVTGLHPVATSGDFLDLLNQFTLPQANTTTLGGIIVGTGLTFFGNGRVDVQYGTTSTTACRGSDSRLSDSREWTAATITQAEAEAGTATTRRAFTAQRVFQAIAAWWAASASKTKLDGIATGATANATDAQLRDRSTHTGTQPLSSLSQSSATTNQVATWNGTAWVAANVSATSIAWSSVTSTPTTLAGYGITDAASSTHVHGNITNAGAIGSTSGQIVVTTTSGVLTTAATISAATQVSGLAAVATSGSATDLSTGTLSASLLPTSGVSAGTYTSVTVDTYGRVTAGSSPAVAYSSLSGVPSTFAPSAHTHPLSDLSQSGATTNQVPQWNGTSWVPANVSGGGGGGGSTTDASQLTSGTLSDARLSFVPLHPFLLMGG
jgi:hypothetical protein